MVDFELSPEQKQLRANAKAFAQTVLSTAPKLYSALPTQNERFRSTLPIYQDAVRSGLIKGQIPISLGGTSNGLLDAAIVVEEFHAVEPSTAITILGTGLGLTPLILAGSKAQHEKFLSPFLKQEGEMLASFMHSEPGGTANWLEKGAPGLQTTAYREGDEWIVNGEKLWTTNSGGWDSHGADLACLVCREVPTTPSPQDPDIDPSSKILILLLTRADIATNPPSAYTILSTPALSGHKSTNGPHTSFTSFRLPHANLLAPPGAGAHVVERTFGTSAALVGAMSVGVMRHAFTLALAFCTRETRGGNSPIISRQAVSDRLVDAKCSIDAARALVWKAMGALESPDDQISWDSRLELACEAKVWCSEQAVGAVQTCMSVVGISSYAEDMGLGAILADAACLPLFDGGNVGVRRRQIEEIMRREGYEPWKATFG
ncbi:hypothetical protein HBH68_215940 [Parastagonospora nodorum]|nr:hypothetical protein HBH68_215940 [Parastagonospora nodorum]KAH5342404.1 hypothetical protein HBI48_223520 [Parastagonospora nodorum]